MLPEGASRDAAVLLQTRGIRGFGDGLVSVVLSAYLVALGFSSARIGIIVSVTLLGSAALTLAVGLRANEFPRRRLLRLVSVLMLSTGVGFALFTGFWWLAAIGMIGTLNPSSGDVSVFLPTEQALLPATVSNEDRTALFARYSLIGSQMDVPARTSYVMAVVSPEERPAAASVTNVPRSLAAALPPFVAGWLLHVTTFGWPLVIGGMIKTVYDLLLLQQFRDHRPPEEM